MAPADLLKPLADSGRPTTATTPASATARSSRSTSPTVKNLTLAWMTQRQRPGAGGRRTSAADAEAAARHHRRRRRHRRLSRAAAARSKARCSTSTARSTSRCPTTPGRSMRATAASSGTTSGRRRAARTSAIAASGMWNNYLYMETPDNYLVSLDAKTGKERWHKVIADFAQEYFSTPAPIVVGNHVLVGTGNDHRFAGLPAVVRSRDRRTAVEALHRADEAGRSRAWTRGPAWMRRGTAARSPGFRAPTIRRRKLYIFGTGNPTPAYTTGTRRWRQPVHVLARRGQRGHRQDGLVLPDLAARHARLGFRANAGPGGRRCSTARCGSWC